jgi:hypothetical protein
MKNTLTLFFWVLLSCSNDHDNAPTGTTPQSFIKFAFKGRNYTLDLTTNPSQVRSASADCYINAEARLVSRIGIYGENQQALLDFGGYKEGAIAGEYKYQELSELLSNGLTRITYFGVYHIALNAMSNYCPVYDNIYLNNTPPPVMTLTYGEFIDYAEGGIKYKIDQKTSSLRVTTSNDKLFEGTFALTVISGSQTQRLTGSFSVRK